MNIYSIEQTKQLDSSGSISCILEVPSSNLGQDTDWLRFFIVFPKSLQASVKVAAYNRPHLLPSQSFQVCQM